MSLHATKQYFSRSVLFVPATALITVLFSLNFITTSYALEEAAEENASQTAIVKSAHFAPDILPRGNPVDVSIAAEQFSTKGSSDFTVEIHSDVKVLGTFASDEAGNLSFTVGIPDGLSPGYHTLHILGPDINDNQLDIQDRVFVVASMNDYDGDGIPNNEDACTVMPESSEELSRQSLTAACDQQGSNGQVKVPPKTPSGNSGSTTNSPAIPKLFTSTFIDPLKTLSNNAQASDPTPEANEPQKAEVLGAENQDVIVVKNAAKEPPRQTYEISIIAALTAVFFLLIAGMTAAKWYAKHSE